MAHSKRCGSMSGANATTSCLSLVIPYALAVSKIILLVVARKSELSCRSLILYSTAYKSLLKLIDSCICFSHCFYKPCNGYLTL